MRVVRVLLPVLVDGVEHDVGRSTREGDPLPNSFLVDSAKEERGRDVLVPLVGIQTVLYPSESLKMGQMDTGTEIV